MNNKVVYGLLAVCIAGISYSIYYQQIYIPKKLKECHDIAISFEKARHYPVDDSQVTNQDISGYMKNILNCFID